MADITTDQLQAELGALAGDLGQKPVAAPVQQAPQFTDSQIKNEMVRRGLLKPTFTPDQIKAEMIRRGLPLEPQGNEFTKGVARGTKNSISLVSEGIPALAKSIGNKAEEAVGLEPSFDPTQNLKEYQKQVEETSKKYPTKFNSYQDVHNLKDFGGYLAAAGGESVSSLVTSMVSGGVGGTIAKAGVLSAIERGGLKFATDEAAKAAVNKALMRGVSYGALASSAPQNIPETYLGLLAKGQDKPMLALGIGAVKSALDVATPEMLIGKLLGAKVVNSVANEGANTASDIITNKWLKNIGLSVKEAGHAAVMEFGTEGAQEGLDVMAEHLSGINPDMFNHENFVRVMDSGLRGAIGGGLAGGAVHAVQNVPSVIAAIPTGGYKGQDKEHTLNPKNDKKFQEEVVGTAPDAMQTQTTLPFQDIENTRFDSSGRMTQHTKELPNGGEETPFPEINYSPTKADRKTVSKFSPTTLKTKRKIKLEDYNPAAGLRETVQDIHSSAILHPINIPEIEQNQAKAMGVNIETLANNSVEDNAKVFKAIARQEEEKAAKKKVGRKSKAQGSLHVEGRATARPIFDQVQEMRELHKPLSKIKMEPAATIITKFDSSGRLIEHVPEAPEIKFSKAPTTPEFQSWFGKSKLRDAVGKPLVLYHGTSKDMNFNKFNVGQRGAFFTTNPKDASDYAEQNDSQGHRYNPSTRNLEPTHTRARVIPAYVKLENPYQLTVTDKNIMALAENYKQFQRNLANKAKKLGHDGIDYGGGNYIVFNPDQVKSIFNKDFNPKDAKFRHEPVQDSYGNAADDIYHQNLMRDAVQAVYLSPEGEVKYQSIIKEIIRIIKETVGNSGELHLFASLTEGLDGNPIHGMQFRNLVYMALNDSTTLGKAMVTAYHEVWHMLEARGVFNKNLIRMLDNNTALLKHYADQDGYLKYLDFNEMLKSPMWREELRANAFSRYAVDRNAGLAEPTTLPSMFKNAFRQAKNILEKIKNAMRGLGFNSIEDMFNSAIDGQHAKDVVEDSVYAIQAARCMRAADDTQERLNQERNVKDLDYVAKARVKSNNMNILHGVWTRTIRSIKDLAERDPMAATVFAAVDRKFQNSTALLNSYLDSLGDYLEGNKDERYRTAELTDRIANLKTKAWLNEDGSLNWKEGDQIKRITDPSVGKRYMSMQKTFAKVLSDYQSLLIHEGHNAFPELLKEDFTLVDAHQALEVAKANRKSSAKAEDTYESIKNIVDQMHNFQDMQKYDYFPKMRFGTFAFVVNDKEGNQVALHTIEKGHTVSKEGINSQTFNKFQMEQALKELKEKYSDTTKYDVIGADGVITNFTNPKPYTMNYNRTSQELNGKLVTTELAHSILYTKGVDKTDLMDVLEDIKLDMTMSKFKKKFNESKNVAGYSKDYDRVMHAYTTGAAHFLASQKFAKEASRLQTEIEKIHDTSGSLRDTLKTYLKYTTAPQEDYQSLRTLNFIWTMGGNLSTAMLQVVTLPTMTLGIMTGYSPNVIKNMQLISKYFAMGIKAMASGDKALLQGNINFSKLLEHGKMDAMQKVANQVWSKQGKTAGVAVENQGKLKTYETDTIQGQIKEKMDILSRFLGKPVAAMEQLTRFATLNATYELLNTDTKAKARAQKMLANNPLFQEMLRAEGNSADFARIVSELTMDSAHGVFGKQGRPELYKGLNGALFMPFQVYPHYALEGMVRMAGQGPEGKRALATTLGAMFMLGGLMGLPGVDALKELLEALENQITGSEEDYEYMITQGIVGATGSTTLAKMVTGGATRAFAGMDVSKRVGIGIPGQEIPLTLLGIRGTAASLAGVEGSIITQVSDAWNQYNNGDSKLEVAAALLPTGAGNLLKAIDMGTEGVKTKNGVQLLTDKEVSAQTRIMKGLGITSDQLATARESAYLDILIQGKYKVGLDRFRKQATNIKTDIRRAREANDMQEVDSLQKKLHNTMLDLRGFVKDNHIRPFPYAAFNKSTNSKAQQATQEKPIMKSINKASRTEVREKNKIYEGILSK